MRLLRRRSKGTVEVGHVKAGHEERGRDADGTDVGFDGGFAVEVVYIGKFAGGELVDVEEGREY